MTTVTDLPTRKADKYFSVATNQDIDIILRLKNFFDGLKISIKHSLLPKKSTDIWGTLKNELSDGNNDLPDGEQDQHSKLILKYLTFLLYECDFLGTDYNLKVDNITVYDNTAEDINRLSSDNDENGITSYYGEYRSIYEKMMHQLMTEADRSNIDFEEYGRINQQINAYHAMRSEWIPKLKYCGFLAADKFQVLLENAFPNNDPAEYIADFIHTFYQSRREAPHASLLTLDRNSIVCDEQWHTLLLDIAEWCCMHQKLLPTYNTIKYIISGWEDDDKSFAHLKLCFSISACGNQILYKSAINRLADTGFPDLSLACESKPQNKTEDPYFLLALLFLPIFKNTEMHDQIDGYLSISENAEETIELYNSMAKNKEFNHEVAGNFTSLRLWVDATDEDYRIIFNGEFVLSCAKYIYDTYYSTSLNDIYDDEEYLTLYWKCLNKGYKEFRHKYYDGNCDLLIFNSGNMRAYQSKEDVIIEYDVDLAFMIGWMSDLRSNMGPVSYHNTPRSDSEKILYELFTDNPWGYSSFDSYIKSNPGVRWGNYKAVIKSLLDEGLDKVADAFLAFYTITEGFVFSGTYPDWDDLLLIIKEQLNNNSDFTEQSIAWINQYLLDNNNKWEAMRFDQFDLQNQNYQIEISEVLNSLLDTIKLTAEEDIIKKIGVERLGGLNSEGKVMLLNCHRQYNQLKAFIDFGTMKDLGGLVFEFFRFMENQLNNKLLSTYMSDSYRNWKCSNKQNGSWSKKPTMRTFLFFLDDVAARRVPPDIVKIVDGQVSFHTNKKFLSKLHKLHKDYRNDPAHGVVLSQEQFLEFWGKLYTDEYMLYFIDYLQPLSKS